MQQVTGTAASLSSCLSDLLRRIDRDAPHLVFVERALPDAELQQLAELGDTLPLVLFGAATQGGRALDAVQRVARISVRHPIDAGDISRLLGDCPQSPETQAVPLRSRSTHLYRGLVGSSAAIEALRDMIMKISCARSNVLISGETGTGKEIVARNIHYHSANGAGPFVAVNCAAIPSDLLESELFGHKKGAFTGAITNRDGRFTLASGGTLFLDEIGDMSPALQVKLLRVLEERVIYPVGCNKPVEMTARLIAATHRDLESRVADGRFREDLYYRLNVVPIRVPALRERREDIPELTRELSCRLKREQDTTIDLTPEALAALKVYDWPGNVRELANLVERLAVVNPGGVADLADLPPRYRPSSEPAAAEVEVVDDKLSTHSLPEDGIDLRGYLRAAEADLIRQALDHSGGTMSRAASLLHVGRTTLCEKVKRLGLADLVKGTNHAQ